MEMTMKIEGLDKLLQSLSKAPSDIRNAANSAIRRSIYTVHNTALPNVPVGNPSKWKSKPPKGYVGGALRRSFVSGVSFKDFYGEIWPNIEYAIYVHEGTYRMTSRPFLKNAMDSVQDEVKGIFEDELNKAMSTIANRTK